MIKFNEPLVTGGELENINKVLSSSKFCGDGIYTDKCNSWLQRVCSVEKSLLTPSCTHALEMAAILIDSKPGDEIIMPSYTFVSSANAFVLRGAKAVFVDIRPDTMNIDEKLIEKAITSKTKAIVVVHYAGVACEMNEIMRIAKKNNLFVIEDAAQALLSKYNAKPLGSIGDIGCISFHETKNYQCGEGGAILINNKAFFDRAEIIREKGTNRIKFLNGLVEKYKWVDIGSSYLLNEISAAFLFAQFENAIKILSKRMLLWREYFKQLSSVEKIEIQRVNKDIQHNAHMFYIKLKNHEERSDVINHLKTFGVHSASHYEPLHESVVCSSYNIFYGENRYTTIESQRILRLPMHAELEISDIRYICNILKDYFND